MILVTGGAGYIGSIVTEKLWEGGFSPVVLDNLSEGNHWAVHDEIPFEEGDYGDVVLLESLFHKYDIEAVFHFAASASVGKSMTDPRPFFDNNLRNGIALLDAMLEAGCRDIVYSSTASVYGEPQYIPIDEDHPREPINAYGRSKLCFEQTVEWYGRAYEMRHIGFRYFNAAGAYGWLGEAHRDEEHLIPRLITSLLDVDAPPFVLFGDDYPTRDGTCIRDYVHVADIADAHILALSRLGELSGQVFNLGNAQGFTNREVVDTVSSVAGRPCTFSVGPRRAGDPAVLVASSQKARDVLGWTPQIPDLDGIVRSAWEWHRTYGREMMHGK